MGDQKRCGGCLLLLLLSPEGYAKKVRLRKVVFSDPCLDCRALLALARWKHLDRSRTRCLLPTSAIAGRPRVMEWMTETKNGEMSAVAKRSRRLWLHLAQASSYPS